MSELTRPPVPYSEPMERALIGAVLLDEQQAWSEGVGSVAIGDFFMPLHRAFWEAMLRLRVEHTPIDGLTVEDMLKRLGYLESTDRLTAPEYTLVYLQRLYGETWATSGCGAWARLIRDYAERRRMIEAGVTMINAGVQGVHPSRTPLGGVPLE